MEKTSIILPTYNEAENIAKLIELVFHHVPGAEVIVVDDDSPDRTWHIVEGMLRQHPTLKLIRRRSGKGLAASVNEGIQHAHGNIIVWMDTDLSMHPKYIPLLLEQFPAFDVVKGSRYIKGAEDTRGIYRKLPSILMCAYINMILRFHVKDPNNQFMAAKRKVFEKVHIRNLGHGQYLMQFLYDCYTYGFRIKEVPYTYTEREKGVSKVAHITTFLKMAFKYGLQPLKIRMGK